MTPQNKPKVSSAEVQGQGGPDLGSLQSQIELLKSYIDEQIQGHIHNGNSAQRNQLDTDIGGLFETVSTVPANAPQSIFDQVKIYSSGTTYRLYWYDAINHAWRYATGT